jgi:hypothetical protein
MKLSRRNGHSRRNKSFLIVAAPARSDDVRFRVDGGLDATIRLLAEGAQGVVGRVGNRGGDARVRKYEAQCRRAVRGRTHVTAMLGRRGV